jgi:hypothetical protein
MRLSIEWPKTRTARDSHKKHKISQKEEQRITANGSWLTALLSWSFVPLVAEPSYCPPKSMRLSIEQLKIK